MSKHFMNKQHGAHMGHEPEKSASSREEHSGATHHLPSIHIHSHENGHTVHILHHDGQHESHEHEHGDSDGIAEHIHQHLGGEPGQDHGFSSGNEMEDEFGAGPGV